MTFEIFELGLIAVQIEDFNFRVWPYSGANRTFKFLSLALLRSTLNAHETWKISGLALLRCKSIFPIFELGLIAVQIGLALLPCTSVVNLLLKLTSPSTGCIRFSKSRTEVFFSSWSVSF